MDLPENNPTGQTPPPPPPAPPVGQPQSFGQVQPGSDNATTALILAIVSFFCCGLLAIAPLIMGNKARAESKATGVPVNGTMNAAWIIAIIVLVLWVISVIFVVATGNVHFTSSSS